MRWCVGAVEELERALDLDLRGGGHRADVARVLRARARRGRAAARGSSCSRRARARRRSSGGSSAPRAGGSGARLGLARAGAVARAAPRRGSARGMRVGMSPGGRLADPALVLRRAAEQSSQTRCRWPPGARYGSVRSPFRIVRPQTSQVTFSWTGRSSFFTAVDDTGRLTPYTASTASCSRAGLLHDRLRDVRRAPPRSGPAPSSTRPAPGDRAQVGRVARASRPSAPRP